jgi:hypothetical protein
MPTHAAMRDDPAKCPPSGGHFRVSGTVSAARWRLDAGGCPHSLEMREIAGNYAPLRDLIPFFFALQQRKISAFPVAKPR